VLAATRSSLPVGAGYLDAVRSVLLAMNASSYQLGQKPLVRILLATRGAVLSSATKKVRKVRTRKGNVRRGSRVGAEVWIR
jgi:hypothetical protein